MTHGLSIRNLGISLGPAKGNAPLVSDIHLDIPAGKIITLMGETGCGKSLIAHALMNILPPEMAMSGEIRYQGKNLVKEPDRELQKLWGKDFFLFPQEPGTALNPLVRARHQVRDIARWVLKKKACTANSFWRRAFESAGLAPKDGVKYPFELSGGMAQRLLAAICLAEPAWFIVADEPTKGLDSRMKTLVVKLMREMAQKGKALLVITHDLDVARCLGGDLYVMYAGRIIESGPVAQISQHPRHPYFKALINALPENGLTPIPLKINGRKPDSGCAFSPRCPQATSLCFKTSPPLKGTGDDPFKVRCHTCC